MTRLAALKRGEVDIAYSIRGELAEELQRTPGLTLKPVVPQASNWIYFPDQWDPKSPWHDLRVRQAANLALDRDGMNQALFLGFSKITNSIIPLQLSTTTGSRRRRLRPGRRRSSCWPRPVIPTASMPALFYCDSSYANMGEVVADNLQRLASGSSCSRSSASPSSPATPARSCSRGILRGASGAFGNAATRLAAFAVKDGAYAYGSYPDIDELFRRRPTSSIARSAPPSSKRSSSWSTRRRSLRRSGSSDFSMEWGRGSGSPGSG